VERNPALAVGANFIPKSFIVSALERFAANPHGSHGAAGANDGLAAYVEKHSLQFKGK
jgi:hypothetical protein